jgi:hypothetical protein
MRAKVREPIARGFNTQTDPQKRFASRPVPLDKPMLRQGIIVGKRPRMQAYTTSR